MCEPISAGTAILVAGGLGAGASLYSGYQQSKAADKMADSQKAIADRQAALSEAEWNRYMDVFAPVENQIVHDVSMPVAEQPGFGRMMAGLDKGYADKRADLSKGVVKFGQYGSGLSDAKMAGLDLSHVRAKAGAFADANQNRFNNMMAVANLGKGLPNNAMGGYQAAGGAYGNLANMYGSSAASTWNSLGNTAGNMAQLYLLNKMVTGSAPAAAASRYPVGDFNVSNVSGIA